VQQVFQQSLIMYVVM